MRDAFEALALWCLIGAVLAGGTAAGFAVFFIIYSFSR